MGNNLSTFQITISVKRLRRDQSRYTHTNSSQICFLLGTLDAATCVKNVVSSLASKMFVLTAAVRLLLPTVCLLLLTNEKGLSK